jgi:hypothetical protein
VTTTIVEDYKMPDDHGYYEEDEQFESSIEDRPYEDEEEGDEDDYNECCGDCYEDNEYLIDGVGFQDPGGRSALRAETKDNPRRYPCPTCGAENVLTAIDKRHGYQCDRCADKEEGYC